MKMKKFAAAAMALVLAAGACLMGCSQKAGKVIVGVDDQFAPMGFRDENQKLVGFDIDVATEVFKRLNMEVEFLTINWTAKEMELNTNTVDCLWNGYTITDKRKEQVDFTDAYMKNAQVVVVLEDSPYQTLADLAGKRLALQDGSTAAEALDEAEDFKASLDKVNAFPDNVKAFMDMEAGMSEAVLLDEVVAEYHISENKKPYRILEEKLALEDYGVGFRQGDELKDKVNDTLKAMAKDGKLAEISTKWFGKDITTIEK